MRTIYVLAGLLLGSFSALAQEAKKPAAADEKSSIKAMLPGEEKLTPQERAERDFIMPVRRKQAAILKAAAQAEAATQATVATEEMSARNFVGPEEVKVEEAAVPVAKPTARTYHRRRPVHHSSAARKKTGTTKKKTVTKKRR